MAGHGRKNVDESIILSLATGRSIPGAAQQAQCSEATVRRRLSDPAFRQQVSAMRTELVSRAIGKLSALGVISVETLNGLLKSDSERIRLGAVRTTLDHMFKGTELEAVVKEVEELKATVKELTKARGRE